jgi:hypothetical protein
MRVSAVAGVRTAQRQQKLGSRTSGTLMLSTPRCLSLPDQIVGELSQVVEQTLPRQLHVRCRARQHDARARPVASPPPDRHSPTRLRFDAPRELHKCWQGMWERAIRECPKAENTHKMVNQGSEWVGERPD